MRHAKLTLKRLFLLASVAAAFVALYGQVSGEASPLVEWHLVQDVRDYGTFDIYVSTDAIKLTNKKTAI